MSNKNTKQTEASGSKGKAEARKKIFLICGIAAAVVIAVVLGIVFFSGQPTKETGGTKGISVSVVPKGGSMTVMTFATEMTYLGDALEEKGLIKPGDSENGVVHTINGIKADSAEQAYWKLFVDGEEVTKNLYDVLLQDGKHYRLEYTIGH